MRAGNDKTAVRILEGVDDAKVTTPAAVPLKYLLLALLQHRQGRADAAVASYDRAQTEWRRLRAPALPEWTDYYTRTRAEVERALGPTAKPK